MRISAALSAVATATVAAVALCAAGPVRAETATCTPITTLPAVISSAGIYCLNQDMVHPSTGGTAITLQASNVTIDCNGRRLDASAAGDEGFATGIEASNRSNITIRGCLLRGFADGIELSGGSGHLVEDNRLDGMLSRGIRVFAGNYIVRRNAVRDTGGGASYFDAYAIEVSGSGEVRDNIVTDVHATSTSARGIFADQFDGGVLAGNFVRGVVPAAGYVGYAYYLLQTDRASVRDNMAYNGGSGGGLACSSSTKVAVTGNHLLRFEQGVTGCALSGTGNVVL